MGDGLTLREKGIQLNHILSALDDACGCLNELSSQGRQPTPYDLERMAKGLDAAREAVTSLRTDYVNHPDGWGS
jgi:hypothetical protein